MDSREYWGPSGRGAWNQHNASDSHYNEYQVPPSHYEEYQRPQDHYSNYPTQSRPPHDYNNEQPAYERPNYSHPPPQMKRGSFRGRTRGRGRGERGAGRAQPYGRGNSFEQRNNGPKQSFQNNWKKSNTASGSNKFSSGQPAWLTKTGSQDKRSTSNSSGPKPAWLTQPATKGNTNISSSSGSQPAWLSTSVAKPNNVTTDSSSTMPAWLQSNNTNNQQPKTTNTSVTNITRSQSPPPPPPPSHPPPANQPKCLPVSVPPMSTQTFQASTNAKKLARQANKAKNKAMAEVKVTVPGDANFISFKNSLQEYSQKKGFPVPVYRCIKTEFGEEAKVEAARQTFQSCGIQRDKKEAEQNAAYEALKALGLISPTIPFKSNEKTGSKRPQPTPKAVAKKLKKDLTPSLSFNNSPNYKSQLNEFCQKFHLPVPIYNTVIEAGGFVTTLIYNKKAYVSTGPQGSKKAAEQNVAQLVLSKVNQAPPPLDQNQRVILQNFVAASVNPAPSSSANATQSGVKTEAIPVSSVQDLTAKNANPAISYKNKLQEIFQKSKKMLPVYETVQDANLHICTVTVDGKTFESPGQKTKKLAEQSAALIALQGLGFQ